MIKNGESMKNKEFLNICYKFFNRFITSDKLIEELNEENKKITSKKQSEKLGQLINEIKDISDKTPNHIDEYVKKEKETIKKLIKKLETIPKDKNEEFLNKQIGNLKKDYNKKMDSYERWFKITEYINQNKYFNECFDNLSEYELLEFIAQYIQAPLPPQLNQEEFDKLVKVGIENDEREWLWRLAFNYENRNINFDNIVDYFIEKKDGYYIQELISAVGESLNLDRMIDEINDKELIEDLKTRKNIIMHYFSEEQINKIISKLN